MALSPATALAGDPYSVRPGRTAFAISPDGQTIVMAAERGDVKQLWIRSLNGTAATPLAGTEDANGPFFSPDGAAIGFWVGRTLKRVPASGGPPVTIAEVDSLGREAATWSTDGNIYVQSNVDGGTHLARPRRRRHARPTSSNAIGRRPPGFFFRMFFLTASVFC